MNLLDIRTVLFGYILSNAVCAAVMTSLWLQNRRRSPGLGFWLADFSLQFTAVLLIGLRGLVPESVSILLGSPLVIGGTLLLYVGLERYTGRLSSQRHNYLLLAVFIGVHGYFTFVQPSLLARNTNLSLALLAICSQCAWLLLRRVSPEMRPDTQLVGVTFGVYSLVSLVRVFGDWVGPQGNDLFKSDLFDTLVILVYQMLFIGLTFGLFLMVNRRLLAALEGDIAERKAAEAALKKSEEKFSKAFHNSPDAVVIASLPDGKIIQVNESFFRMAGFTPEEIAGKTTLELHLWESLTDQDQFVAALQKTGRVLNFETTFRKKTGELFQGWISGELLQLPEGPCVLTVIHDITERKLAEEALRESENRYRSLFDNMLNGLAYCRMLFDQEHPQDFIYLDVNHAFETLTGLKDVVGKKASEVIPGIRESDPEVLETYGRVALTGIPAIFETYVEALKMWFSISVYSPRKEYFVAIFDVITERKQAEEKLSASEVRYRRLFEAAKDGILILDPETGAIVDANPYLIEMLGLSLEEVRRKKIWELGFFNDIVANQAHFLELQRNEYIRYENLSLETADGRRISVEFVSNVYQVNHHKVIQCNIRDITERKQAENIIQARLRLVEFAAHHSLDDLLQKTLDEVCALTDSPIGFYHFVAPDQETLSLQAWSTRTLQEYCTAAGKGLHYSVEAAGVWADSIRQRRPVIHNDYASLPHRKGLPEGHAPLTRELVVPILREERIVAILGVGNRARAYLEKDIDLVAYLADVAWEIAERKRAQEALQAYSELLEEKVEARTRELRDAQAQLVRREKLTVLGQISGGIAHELRQPLAVISNAVYFLQAAQPNADPTLREYLGLIAAELHTADHIITDLLSFARAGAAEKEPVAVAALVEQLLAHHPAPAGVAVQLCLPSDLPPVYVDPRQLGQVLNNLISNAYQAMPHGGQLALSAASAGAGFVTLAVADTGDGIAPENLSKLFEPLFTTKPKGIGLGLAVTKMLVEANGGAIEVTSEAGRGATFQLTLPVKEEPV